MTVSAPPSRLRTMPASWGKCLRVFQREGVRGGGVEPHVADVVDLLPFGRAVVVAEEALGGARLVPGADALRLDGVA